MLYESNGNIIAWFAYSLKDKKENESIFFGDNSELGSNDRYQNFKSELKKSYIAVYNFVRKKTI